MTKKEILTELQRIQYEHENETVNLDCRNDGIWLFYFPLGKSMQSMAFYEPFASEENENNLQEVKQWFNK